MFLCAKKCFLHIYRQIFSCKYYKKLARSIFLLYLCRRFAVDLVHNAKKHSFYINPSGLHHVA